MAQFICKPSSNIRQDLIWDSEEASVKFSASTSLTETRPELLCLLTSCSSRDESRVQEVHNGLVLDTVRGFLVTLGVPHNVLSVLCEGIQTHCVILRLALIAIQSKSCKNIKETNQSIKPARIWCVCLNVCTDFTKN